MLYRGKIAYDNPPNKGSGPVFRGGSKESIEKRRTYIREYMRRRKAMKESKGSKTNGETINTATEQRLPSTHDSGTAPMGTGMAERG